MTGSGASTLKKNTLFKTTTTAKEQGTTSQSTVLERKYTYNTQGMVTQLDRDVAGTLMNSSAGTTVPLSDKYSYDAFGRFDTHQHAIGGSTEYTLDMTYNKAGGIVKKDALATGITNFQDLNYTLNYNYSASNPHQLADVIDSKSGAQSHYQYNSSGSIQEIQDPAAGGPQSFFWNEEQWLSGVSNDLGVHHYVYDYKGERVMKSSVMQSSVQVNDKNIDDIEYLEPYTLYINPYYVVTELQGGDKVSKHYYMNTQRVATDISINYQAQESMAGPQQPNARDPKKPSEDTASVNYNAAFADLQATLNALGHQKLDVNGLGQQPTLEEYYPELVRETAFNSTAAKNAPESTTRVLFWYHPDYLGNVDLVTERDGKTYEFFTYNPWGEEMHQYNANTFSFSSPYRFNAKEKDSETGLHYYGARYYQPKLSMWLSVDPLASERSWLTPYNFVQNNPITRIDPTGALDTKYVNEITRETLADTKDGSEDVVVVPKAKVENFKELVKYTPEKKLNSPEFNNNMKAGFLGFETIEGMEGYLGNASTQWSRQKLIEYRQNPTVGNWSIFLGAEVLSQNANPLNHLPSPINIKASPKLKVSPKAMIKTPAKKPNPWLLFNREMGTGKFTKENFGGSSEAAAKARRAAYDKWTTENGYLFLDNGK